MSADKSCQTIMCLGGNPKPDPCPELSSFDSDFMYLSDDASSECSDESISVNSEADIGVAVAPTELATREALAECFEQKLEAAREGETNPQSIAAGLVGESDSSTTDSLPSRFTVDSESV